MQIYIVIFFVIAIVANKIWKCSKWGYGIFQSTSEVHTGQEKPCKAQAVLGVWTEEWRLGLN